MVAFIAAALLVLFVAWGATADPGRPFSWAMYSGSSKGFFWTDADGCPRVPGYDEMRLAPDSHYLSLSDLQGLTSGGSAPVPVPVEGLIIGSRGNWLVAYDGQHLRATPVPDGEELDALAQALRRLECPRA
ncbi:MAG: hypothetical protein ACRD0K_09520 [Egibacteraceae bacterium]